MLTDNATQKQIAKLQVESRDYPKLYKLTRTKDLTELSRWEISDMIYDVSEGFNVNVENSLELLEDKNG